MKRHLLDSKILFLLRKYFSIEMLCSRLRVEKFLDIARQTFVVGKYINLYADIDITRKIHSLMFMIQCQKKSPF